MRSIGMIVVLITTWFSVTKAGWVRPLYLPEPELVLASVNGMLFVSAWATIARTLLGYGIGLVLVYGLYCLSFIFGVYRVVDSQATASRAIPPIALMPLLLLWFGFGEIGRVTVVTLTAFSFYLSPLHSEVMRIPREWMIVGTQSGQSRFCVFWLIVVPATFPGLIGALRITMSVCFTIAIASDYMGAESGLGRYIDSARVTFNVPGVFAAIILAAAVGIALDRGVVLIGSRIAFWDSRVQKA